MKWKPACVTLPPFPNILQLPYSCSISTALRLTSDSLWASTERRNNSRLIQPVLPADYHKNASQCFCECVCVCVLTSRRICADIWGCMDVCAALSWDCNALSLEQKGRPVKYEADEQRLRLARVSQHTHTHTASLSSSQISAGSVD